MRRFDPTLITILILLVLACGLVTSFLFVSHLVSRNDIPQTPSTTSPTLNPILYFPTPLPVATLPSLSPDPPAVSSTQDGITITVRPRYVDPNTLVLTYTVNGPTHSYPYSVDDFTPDYFRQPRLITDDGTELPLTNDSRYISWFFPPSEAYPYGEGTQVYDTSVLGTLSETIHLHYYLPLYLNNTPYWQPIPPPYATANPGVHNTPTPIPPPTQIPPPSKPLTYTFDLITPVDRRCRLVQSPVTVEKSGVQATLNYVLVTATEARFSITYSGTVQDMPINSSWASTGTLDTGQGTPQIQLWDDCSLGYCGNFTGFRYRDQSLLNTPAGQWLLRVDKLNGTSGKTGGFPEVPGPWVFNIDMPTQSVCMSVPTPVGTKTP
ncbi:MAG: hypothetical protein WCD37_14105 [Chloroflexia bacterium]